MRQPAARGALVSLSFVTGLMVAVAAGAGPDRDGACKTTDLVGRWRLSFTSPDGQARECHLTIVADGPALKGHYAGSDGARPVRGVVFTGGELTFCVDGKFAGTGYTLTYKGRPREGAIRGAVRWKYGWVSGNCPFEGEKLAERVADNR